MRIRIRGPSGQSTVSLQESATIGDLLDQIKENTSLPVFDIRHGYPPKSLALDQFGRQSKVTDIGVDLNGEQLIIIKRNDSTISDTQPISTQAPEVTTTQPSNSSEQRPNFPSSKQKVTRSEDDPPEIPSPNHGGTIVLRIMPDDNSCLFRAVGSAVLGAMDTMTELRSIVAQTIHEHSDVYTRAVLERSPDDYCRWIQSEEAWGGGIELSILSKHFDIEICSIDVQTLRIDRFNEGRPTRCIVVYSGIHYDTIALSPSDPPFNHAYASPDFDTKIFDSADQVILEKAVELCRILQQQHYYTDTAKFQVKCSVCGGVFIGEKGAARHASETGHYDFGEAS
ncbi:zinc finger protein [Coccidioides immitis RS]|uniref:Ubiquitin thioesterase OTU n=4 Tax=Coccidioides immitis TaxID=5501 RepID=J3KKL8_COCIM|nr:zinc finger protein [Coccidioides immitis RS]EAS36731.3 zinc finger protein [Coccidioides immitis RS]KMP02101.1 ubiquitin thioesterase OTU1 [Coccidioides immitis RMSCC 2394]KMU79794.1 ubiquitin thioesterase OTU1 [Coccidioides immitis RMSCC 3703]KMU88278.1 ubiquitin thioesterase OTU1 [Coccidioides immitis H538.4]